MRLEAHKDLTYSQFQLTMASNYMAETKPEIKQKYSQKFPQPKRRTTNKLKQYVKKEKIQIIKKQYVSKLKRLVPGRIIPEGLMLLRKEPTNLFNFVLVKLEQKQGFKISSFFHLCWKSLILIKVMLMLIISSFKLVFREVQQNLFFYRTMELIFFITFADIFMNITFQRFEDNKNYKNILAIFKCYLRKDFIIDILACLLNFVLLLMWESSTIDGLLLVVILVKLWYCLGKIQILEHIYIANVFHEKYYTIMRVLFFNCLVAHFVAIITLLMTQMDSDENWMTKKNINDASWMEQYIWAYYWAVNIMFTVGFGDVVPATKLEALVIIFVEMISCIILAYNINVVGSVLSDIKEQERERKNQLRILFKMSQQNHIEKETVQQAANYIDQSFKIKEKFPYDEQDRILESLPQNISSQYRKQTHRRMLLHLPFSYMFSHKSLMKIAQKINRKLSHPEEIIWKKQDPLRLVILNKGKLGLTFRRGNSKLNGKVIQTFQTNQNQSKLLSLKFLKNERFTYDLKSINYSVVYHLGNQEFIEALSQKPRDYEIYFNFRDKSEFRLEADELYECIFCPGCKHDLFNCPKMHLILMKRYVIIKKTLSKRNQSPNPRFPFVRPQKYSRFLKSYREIKSEQEFYLNEKQNQLPANTNFQITNSVVQICPKNVQKSIKKQITSMYSIKGNFPFSNALRELQIEKLNTLFVAKINDQSLWVGFWDVQCDIAHNYNIYLRHSNSENLKQMPLTKSRLFRLNSSSSPFTSSSY